MSNTIVRTVLTLALLSVPAAFTHAQSAGRATAPAAAPAERVSVNTATVEQLVALPGIGPSRAAAIVELRKQLGGFKKLEDLMRVKGIGRKTYRDLEPMLKL